MKSERTVECKKRTRLFSVLHFLCVFGPFLYFIPYSFIFSSTGQKLFLSLELVTVLIIAAFAALSDLKTRGGYAKIIYWLCILGITYCLEQAKIFIYIMCVCAIIDELLITKLRDKYKDAYRANKEIDRRD